MKIKITSAAFSEGQFIPAKYTRDGKEISPPLKWNSAPKETRSIALICDDPDAPGKAWVHWVLYNLPAETIGLPENFPDDETLEDGTRQGVTDFGKTGYGGPCPPPGKAHRYYFRIYALDKKIDAVPIMDKESLQKEMAGHIIAEGQLMGKYQRK